MVNWKTKFLRIVNSHAPFQTRRTKLNKTPWIHSALKKGMRCHDATTNESDKNKESSGLGQLQKSLKSNQQ